MKPKALSSNPYAANFAIDKLRLRQSKAFDKVRGLLQYYIYCEAIFSKIQSVTIIAQCYVPFYTQRGKEIRIYLYIG